MNKFLFCYQSVALKKGKPMEGVHEKEQNENLWSRAKLYFVQSCGLRNLAKQKHER